MDTELIIEQAIQARIQHEDLKTVLEAGFAAIAASQKELYKDDAPIIEAFMHQSEELKSFVQANQKIIEKLSLPQKQVSPATIKQPDIKIDVHQELLINAINESTEKLLQSNASLEIQLKEHNELLRQRPIADSFEVTERDRMLIKTVKIHYIKN